MKKLELTNEDGALVASVEKLELTNEEGALVASVAATKQGVWITLESIPGKPTLAFDTEAAGLCLSVYDNTTNAVDAIPAVAFAIEKDDVRLQVSRPGKDFTNVSLFEVLKKIEKL